MDTFTAISLFVALLCAIPFLVIATIRAPRFVGSAAFVAALFTLPLGTVAPVIGAIAFLVSVTVVGLAIVADLDSEDWTVKMIETHTAPITVATVAATVALPVASRREAPLTRRQRASDRYLRAFRRYEATPAGTRARDLAYARLTLAYEEWTSAMRATGGLSAATV